MSAALAAAKPFLTSTPKKAASKPTAVRRWATPATPQFARNGDESNVEASTVEREEEEEQEEEEDTIEPKAPGKDHSEAIIEAARAAAVAAVADGTIPARRLSA